MADPFSIVNLLATAASLTKAILSYVAAVKDAPKEVEKLRQSLASLVDVAEQLVDLMEDEDVKKDFGEVSSLYNAIAEFVVTLDVLQKRLDKRAAKGIHKALDRLKWPFAASETQNLIDTLQKYVQVFQFGLTIQGSRVLSQTSQKASELLKTSKKLSQTQTAIIKAISALPEHEEIMYELRELRIGTDFVQIRTQEASDHAFLQKLSTLDFHSKQKDAYGKRHAHTGQWLLETGEFVQWSEGQTCSVLWCPGNPGAGKTVITSIAVNSIAEKFRGQRVAVIYVYCDYKNSLTQSVSALMSSLLRQLVEQASHSERTGELRRFYEEDLKHRDVTADELFAWICKYSKEFHRVYAFVDALDECPEYDRDRLLTHLQRYSRLDHVRLFLTSRLNVSIGPDFFPLLRVEVVANTSDMAACLESEIYQSKRLALFVQTDPLLKQEIIDRVVEKANGMFLLASLQVDSLCMRTNISGVRAALKLLPTGIFATYDDAFRRILDQPKDDADLGMKVISLIFSARRPLDTEELRHALAVQAGDFTLDKGAFTELEIILSVTAGLVGTIQTQTSREHPHPSIRFVHYTLQEYLASNRERLIPNSERNLAGICLAYLSLDEFEDGPCPEELVPQRLDDFAFLRYARYTWSHHLLQGAQLELLEQILTFLQDTAKVYALLQVLHYDGGASMDFGTQDDPTTTGHLAAFWNLSEVLLAVSKSQGLDTRAVDGSTPLFFAANAGHPAIVRILINAKVDVNARNNHGRTALLEAISQEHHPTWPTGSIQSVIAALLENGADINVQDNWGVTPLFHAVEYELFGIVQYLLGRQARLDFLTRYNESVVYAAARGTDLNILKLLLDCGAHFDTQDEKGLTPLHNAAKTVGQEDFLSMLIHRGACPNVKDFGGRLPLHYAAWHAFKENIEVLMQYSDVNAQDAVGRTPLHYAYYRNAMNSRAFVSYIRSTPPGTIEQLLKAGASDNVADAYGMIPSDYLTWDNIELVQQWAEDYEVQRRC